MKRFASHFYILLPASVVMIVFIFMVTHGTFELFDREDFGQFYDAQALSLLRGHWDVPLHSIAPEQYIYRNKAYGYFGFAPAIPRMALNLIFPAITGAWSRLSMTAACAVTLAASYSILLQARGWGNLIIKRDLNALKSREGPIRRAGKSSVLRHANVWRLISLTRGASSSCSPNSGFCSADLSSSTDSLSCRTKFTAGEKWANGGFVILVGLGSTTIFLASRAFIYHEAIIWASALAIACYSKILTYVETRRIASLSAACILAFFCFFCRASSGCGPLLAIAVVSGSLLAERCFARGFRRAESSQTHRRLSMGVTMHVTLGLFTLLATFAIFVAINHAKFDTFLNPSPVRYYHLFMSEPGRYERTGGQWLRIGNIPTTVWAYLSPQNIVFDRTFPWVDLQFNHQSLPGSKMDGGGPFTNITASMPAFLALAWLGMIWLYSRRQYLTAFPMIVLIAAFVGLIPVLAFCAVDNRYLHEFLPLLVLLAAFGFQSIRTIGKTTLRRVVVGALLILGAYQVVANCSIALSYQRQWVWGVPARERQEFQRWQHWLSDGGLR